MKPLIFQQPIFSPLEVAPLGHQGLPSELLLPFLLDLTLLSSDIDILDMWVSHFENLGIKCRASLLVS